MRPPRLHRAVLPALCCAAAAAGPAHAQDHQVDRTGKSLGWQDLRLTGGAPAFRTILPLSPLDSFVRGVLTLTVHPGKHLDSSASSVSLLVDGKPVAGAPLTSRTQTIQLPFLSPLAGGQAELSLSVRQRARGATVAGQPSCLDPSAPGLVSHLSVTRLQSVVSRRVPLLSDGASALVTRRSDNTIMPLNVDIGRLPRPAALPAVATVATAMSVAVGQEIPIRLVSSTAQAHGPLLQLVPRRGHRGRIGILARQDGSARVRLFGRDGAELLRGAQALARHLLPDAGRTMIPSRVTAPTAPQPGVAPVSPLTLSGTGDQGGVALFRIPPDQEITGTSALQLDIDTLTPGGGQLAVRQGALNVRLVPIRPDQGIQRVQFGFDNQPQYLVNGQLRAGLNQVGFVGRLAQGPTGCNDDGFTPSLSILPTSRLVFHGRGRVRAESLGLWPFPLVGAGDPGGSRMTIRLPAAPDDQIVQDTLAVVEGAARGAGRPLSPRFVEGAAALRARTLWVAAAPADRPPLPGESPPLPGEVLLAPTGQAIVAVGSAGLSLLRGEDRRPRLVGDRAHRTAAGRLLQHHPSSVSAYAKPRAAWIGPTGVIAALLLLGIATRLARARRRLRALPEPALIVRDGA